MAREIEPPPSADDKMARQPPKLKESDPVLRRLKDLMKKSKTVKMAKGGKVRSSCDGIAKRGKTKGRMV